MGSRDPKLNVKLQKTEMEGEKIKLTDSSMEVENVKSKMKIQTSSTQSVKVKSVAASNPTAKPNVKVSSSSMESGCKQAVASSTVTEKLHVNVTSSTMEYESNKQDDSNQNEKTISLPVFDKPCDPIKNVTNKKEIWRLGVIIDDMWTVYKGGNQDHVDMLLRDVKGDNIQATILEKEIELWKEKLCQGKTYYMRNFKVYENDNGYKYSAHKFKLNFVGATLVDEYEIPGIPIHAFNFKDFQEILGGKYKPDQLVDAIGVVDSLKKCVQATANKKANVGFTIKDLRENILDVTLWDDYAGEFLDFYNQHTENVPAVLILKNARVKEPNGIYNVQLTNVWDGTKLLWDTKIPHINEFLSSLPKDVPYPTQQFSSSYSTQYQSQTSGASQLSLDEKFIKQGTVMQLKEMRKQTSDTFCVTVATTEHILLNNTGWYFRGCHNCPCKADGNQPPFVCRNKHQTTDPLIKYKLDVQVSDGTDQLKFVFWDNTLEQLIGLNAATLLEIEKKNGHGHPQDYPTDFDNIMERKFAFRVKWSPSYGGQASVLEVKDSQPLIDKILECLPVAESNYIESVTSQDEGLPIDCSPSIQKFTQDDIDKFASLDDSILSTPNVSNAVDIDTTASSQKTPAKRSLTKGISVQNTNLDSQFSATRSGKTIKKEKL